LLMGAAIGGRHIVTGVTTILTRRRTAARITGGTVTITQRLTMTLPRERMVGNRQPTVRMVRQREAPVTILTPERTREVLRFRHLMVVEVQPRHITLTPAPMHRRGRVRAQTLSGEAPMCRAETRALLWAITRQPTEESQALRIPKEEKWPLLARSGGTVQLVRLPAVTCTPDTMAMSTRTQVAAGRSTTMEAGTQ
jgi:hypothetical protein